MKCFCFLIFRQHIERLNAQYNRKMTTAQLDMLTDRVHDTLLNYINIVNDVYSNDKERKVGLLYGLIEYILTDEVIHGIIIRTKFNNFSNILLKKLEEYRQDRLVLEHEHLMKAMDELHGIIYDNCILKRDCKSKNYLYKENTRPRGKLMLERPEFVKYESIAKLKKAAACDACGACGDACGDAAACDACGDACGRLRRSERLMNKKRKRDE